MHPRKMSRVGPACYRLLGEVCAMTRRRVLPPRGGYPRGSKGRLRPLDIAVKERGELRLRQRADAGRLDVAVLEQHQRRNAADAEARRHLLVVVDVDLRYLQAAAIFLGHFFQDRGNGLARTAPLRPVIDEDGDLGLQDLGLEAVVGDLLDFGTAHGSSGAVAGGMPLLWGRSGAFPIGRAARVLNSGFEKLLFSAA